MSILEVKDLRKTFGSIVAVDRISFEVMQGEVFTIIGPNGAGKTTTLEMIEGLQEPDTGTIALKGLNWKQHGDKIKQFIGVQPQSSALFDLLTVYENLDVFASFYNKTRSLDEIMELINLTDHRNKKVKALSGGQKQRLAIGLAMVNDPDILFLDEPTTGLDPQARRNIWDVVLKLKELGKTTILTTHYMEEAEKLSDRVCIVDQGRVVALDTSKRLIQQLTQEREIELVFAGGPEAAKRAANHIDDEPSVSRSAVEGARVQLWSVRPEETLYRLFRFTTEQQLEVEQVTIKDMSLEDVFIAFTGKEWRD
ncbi:ABC transporter ATP-binding protein [Paenibacillus koleovorans]|uniref:ABC transporter ATP-binding protein n=1 Tax=Paenibacillus koleovorans TaxID=121608 RepID=UPI000FD86C67|nr:ABC transporter ATP-binding protein [Paenibacillus koleovorans]